MPKKHPGMGNTRARGNDGGGLPPSYKWPLVCLGGFVALLGAATGEPLTVVIGITFIVAVLGLSFKPPGGWSRWLK